MLGEGHHCEQLWRCLNCLCILTSIVRAHLLTEESQRLNWPQLSIGYFARIIHISEGGIICTVHPAKLPDPLIIKPFISLTLCLVLLCLAFINSLEQLLMQLNLDGDWGVLFPADSNLHSSKTCHRICARHHNTDANYILIIKHSNKQTERKSPIITRF